MKTRLDPRPLVPVTIALLCLLVAVGCTTRPEPSEGLEMQGNHSAGDLIMVTADTSSNGYHYLEPDLAPDRSRIILSADWTAVPEPGPLPDVIPLVRQFAVTPNQEQLSPMLSLYEAGGVLVNLDGVEVQLGPNESLVQSNRVHKGHPRWLDDRNIVFWMSTQRGARIFRCQVPPNLHSDEGLEPEILYYEPSDAEEFPEIPFWEHGNPAISPDGRWVAFSRYGYQDVDTLSTATNQSIWAFRMPQEGETSELAFQVTGEASQVDGPAWSPDGRTIAFHATLDLVEDATYFTKEIFTVDFDTTGLAANGEVELNHGLQRLTYTTPQPGSPIAIRNETPSFSSEGNRIAFVSDRRVPTLTYTDRNIWWVPADGSLEPQLLFFTRADDVDPSFTGGPGDEVLISSQLGFPTSVLDRLTEERVQDLLEIPGMTTVRAQEIADVEREELEFFEGVMSHIFLLSSW